MNPSLLRFRPLAVAVLCAVIAPAAFAVTATTDPVGFVKVSFQGSADSYSSIPFKRTPEYAGSIASVAGNTLTVSGTPNFGNLVYTSPSQPKHYYILVTSGAKIGLSYSIDTNSTNTLTVDPAGDTITSLAGSTFQVIPYDTLASLFPAGAGVVGSPSHGLGSRQTEILIPDNVTAGTDLPAFKSYYYYSGSAGVGAGWRLSGVTGVKADDDVLYPDSHFVVRQNTASTSEATYMGTVHMGALSTPIGTIAANTDQDNAISLPIPANLSLAQLSLYPSVFTGSSSHGLGSRQDEVLVWDNAVNPGVDKPADRSYYYYTGTAGLGAGWRLSGVTGALANDTVVLTPTTSLTVRKKGNASPGTVVWTVTPPYAP